MVLSDQMMPGMTGTDLAKTVRAIWPKLPFLLVSGVNEIPAGAEFADRFVSKIAGPDALFAHIKDVLIEYGLMMEVTLDA
jgi:CheY-like chemotaxis protein